MNDDAREEQVWESGFEGHEAAQGRRLARLPLAEKLAWLEEAQRLARHLAKERGDTPKTSESPRPPRAD